MVDAQPNQLTLEALVSLLNQHVTPTFVLGEDGSVLMWNRACSVLTGLDAETLIGTKDHWKGFYTERFEKRVGFA